MTHHGHIVPGVVPLTAEEAACSVCNPMPQYYGAAGNNLQPYIVVRLWKRTA